MLGWLKLLTRSGRQEAVAEAAKEFLTPDRIAELATEGISKALSAGAEKLTEERVAQVSVGCEKGGNFCAHLGAAINPEGEEGVAVTANERAVIESDVRSAITALVTKDAIDAAIDKAVQYVP